MRTFLTGLGRLWILNRRYLHRPAFLLVLLLPTLLALGLSALSAEEAGLVTVAVYAGEDPLAAAAVRDLETRSGVLRCIECASPEEAAELVRQGRADAAWSFSEHLTEELDRYAAGKRTAAVTVTEREDNVLLMLSRERLYAALYPSAAAAVRARLLSGLGDSGPGPAAAGAVREELIRFSYLDGAEYTAAEGSYLLSPLRGLLGLLLALGGLAAAVLLAQDRAAGALAWLRPGLRPWYAALCLLLPMADLALSVYLALWLGGLLTAPARELGLLALLVFAGGGFAAAAERLLKRPERLCLAAVVLALLMLALCPIFLRAGSLSALGRLFPLWHYLAAVHDPGEAASLALCGLAAWILALLPRLRLRRSRRVLGNASR